MTKKKKTRKHKLLSRPYLGAILLLIYAYSFISLGSLFGVIFDETVVYCAVIVISILILIIHKAWFRPEFKGYLGTEFFRDRKIMVIIMLFLVLDTGSCIMGFNSTGFTPPTFESLTMALCAGFNEETAFRVLVISIMMRAFKDRNKYMPALIFSSVIFGLVHLTNLRVGAGLEITLCQVIVTGTMGFFLGAIYIRTGSIIAPVFIHFFHDFICFMIPQESTGILNYTPTPDTYVSLLITSVVQVLFGIMLIKGKKEDIIALWNRMWILPQQESNTITEVIPET